MFKDFLLHDPHVDLAGARRGGAGEGELVGVVVMLAEDGPVEKLAELLDLVANLDALAAGHLAEFEKMRGGGRAPSCLCAFVFNLRPAT